MGLHQLTILTLCALLALLGHQWMVLGNSDGKPWPKEDHVTAAQLGTTNLTEIFGALPEGQRALVEFYASWCPACRNFAPTFEKFAAFLKASRFNGLELFIGRVDCATEVELCGAFEVPSFPTIYIGQPLDFMSKSSKSLTKFSGPNREIPTLVKWVSDTLQTPLVYVESSTSPPPAVASSPLVQVVVDPKAPVWDPRDVEGATLQFWKIIAGSPQLHRGEQKRTALLRMVEAWGQGHPVQSCRSGAHQLALAYAKYWPAGEETAPGELLRYAICGSSPSFTDWVACKGSKPETRGFSCGLWLLFHTMALRLPAESAASTMMGLLLAFNEHFFQCEMCQKHFSKMLTSKAAGSVASRRELVMWLWRAHNEVNQRLQVIETKYGHSTTGDPAYPKVIWPTPTGCPECYVSDEDFDEDAVYEYIVDKYGPEGAGAEGSSFRMLPAGSTIRRLLGLPLLALLLGLLALFLIARHRSARRKHHAAK